MIKPDFMKKASILSAFFCIMLMMSSCNRENKAAPKAVANGETADHQKTQVSIPVLKGDYCFLKAENKDTTSVHLTISGNKVNGEMTWQPWEKDGAAGTLSGKLISDSEMEVLYNYTIEGSKQTETKIMKIGQDKLYIKAGELTDPENNGNLVYKDPSNAVYNEILNKVSCK